MILLQFHFNCATQWHEQLNSEHCNSWDRTQQRDQGAVMCAHLSTRRQRSQRPLSFKLGIISVFGWGRWSWSGWAWSRPLVEMGWMSHDFSKHQNREERWHARNAPTRIFSFFSFFLYKVTCRTSDEPLTNTPPSLRKLKMAFAPEFYTIHSQQLASIHMHESCGRTRHISHLE